MAQIDEKPYDDKVSVAGLDDTEFHEGDEEPKLGWRPWAVAVCCCWCYFGQIIILSGFGFWHSVAAAEVGGVGIALWLSQSYNVVNAVLGPPLTRISDLVGRRWVICGTAVFGVVGGIMLSAGQNVATLIVGGCLYGVFWAAIAALQSVVGEVLPRRWRGVAQTMVQFIGTMANPVAQIGGAAALISMPGGVSGWRVMNALGTCCMFFFTLALFFLYKPLPVPNPQNRSVLERTLDFDRIGSLLLACSLIPLLMALIWGGNTYTWKSAPVISTLVVGIVFMFIFGAHQIWYTRTGLFHHDLFKHRNFAICLVGLAVEGFVYFPFNNFYGTEANVLFDSNPIGFALRYNCFCLGQMIAYPIFAYISYRYRSFRPILCLGFACFLGAAIGLAIIDESNGANASIGLAALAGFGFGSPIALIPAVVQLSVDPALIGVATALTITARSVGGAVGTSVVGAVFTSKLTAVLGPYIANAAINAGLPSTSITAFVTAMATGNSAGAAAVPGVTPSILAAGGLAYKQAYAHGFRYAWIVQTPFILLALICCACLQSVKKEMNARVDRPVEVVHYRHRQD